MIDPGAIEEDFERRVRRYLDAGMGEGPAFLKAHNDLARHLHNWIDVILGDVGKTSLVIVPGNTRERLGEAGAQ